MLLPEQPAEAAPTQTDTAPVLSIEDEASGVFGATLPQFNAAVDELSKNELARVLKALGEAPLNQEKFKFVSPKEVTAFELGMKLTHSKFVIIDWALKQKQEPAPAAPIEGEVKSE